MKHTGEARLHLLPTKAPADTEGQLAVAVATASDSGGPVAEIARIGQSPGSQPTAALDGWAEENRKAAAAFWSASSLTAADPVLENLWYQTLHARRAAYRRGAVPPGLFLPSTVQDYSHWHGDYHTNYNIQGPFWGDYAANHPELGDAYFDAIALRCRSDGRSPTTITAAAACSSSFRSFRSRPRTIPSARFPWGEWPI